MARPQARSNVATFDEVQKALRLLNLYVSGVAFSTNNVSDPPSDAEIDAAFGTPAQVGGGFIGVIDDNGGGVSGDVWLCVSNSSAWFYVGLTKAV
jgi:hypothetical protein